MYLILFGVGVGFIALSLIIGELVEIEGTSFAFLRPTLIAVFLTVMGGLGLLLTPRMDGILGAGFVLGISLVSAFITAILINQLVIIPLYKAQNTSAFNMQDTIGLTAKVVSPIPQGGYGKIVYTYDGNTLSGPAKSESGEEIARNTTVEIVYIEKNTYHVRKK
jgi:membrane-bound ClpP family serine protease